MFQDEQLLWLEEVEGKSALDWVKEQNQATAEKITPTPLYQKFYNEAQTLLNADDRLPEVSFYGDYLYNFWQDQEHVKGIYRRTTLEEYKKENPSWETVIDLDQLAKDERENWVWTGDNPLYDSYDRTLIFLSRGGKDACVVREFDLVNKKFIEGGFKVEESKSRASWIDRDTLLIGATIEGEPLTNSGYPARLLLWKRGTKFQEAKEVIRCEKTEISVGSGTIFKQNQKKIYIYRFENFYRATSYIFENDKLIELDFPHDSSILDFHHHRYLALLKSDWKLGDKVFVQGSLVAVDAMKAETKVEANDVEIIIEARKDFIPEEILSTDQGVYVKILTNVKSELHYYHLENNKWIGKEVGLPPNGSIDLWSQDEEKNQLLVSFQDFLSPSTVYLIEQEKITALKARKKYFNNEDYTVEQHFAISKDGEKIPYFQIAKKDLELSGQNPTLQYGYGGFEVSLSPSYLFLIEKLWLSQGGVYILTNIRGGGEFGPAWHQAALKENRQRAYDDFAAISEDLIARKVTSRKNLGIMGGSNGGLLMGVMATQRPELYNAVLCQVPLLDMKRYHLLLAGASWMAEYGDPDLPEDWDYIKKFSPFQNVFENKKYPPILFMTSTKDDRVHPGHARKMAAKMKEFGHEVEYYENIDGGHGGSSTQGERAHWHALQYCFLIEKLRTTPLA